MRQAGEELCLARKSIRVTARRDPRIDELHCARAFEATVVPFCQPDFAHAAAADQPLDGVRAHALPGTRAGSWRGFQRFGEKACAIERVTLADELAYGALDVRKILRQLRQKERAVV